MSWFRIKSKVDVNSNKGDNIKNSNITINSSNKDVTMEIYYKLGRVESDIKNIYHDIKEIKNEIKDIHEERQKESEYSFGRKLGH